MAKTPDKTETDVPAAEATESGSAEAEQSQRQIVVHAQYVKDLSFENPNAPDILMSPPAQPDVEIGVNVGARGLNEDYTAGDAAVFHSSEASSASDQSAPRGTQ